MPKIKLSRAMRKGPHRAGRKETPVHGNETSEQRFIQCPCGCGYSIPWPSKETQAQYSARVEREGKPPFGPISKANTGAAPTTPCDHVAPRKGCSYCQQRLQAQGETLDRTTKLLLGGNVADYFEAALDCDLSVDEREALQDCPLISVCGIACKEAIDAARILLDSARRHLGSDFGEEDSIGQLVLRLCETIYCG